MSMNKSVHHATHIRCMHIIIEHKTKPSAGVALNERNGFIQAQKDVHKFSYSISSIWTYLSHKRSGFARLVEVQSSSMKCRISIMKILTNDDAQNLNAKCIWSFLFSGKWKEKRREKWLFLEFRRLGNKPYSFSTPRILILNVTSFYNFFFARPNMDFILIFQKLFDVTLSVGWNFLSLLLLLSFSCALSLSHTHLFSVSPFETQWRKIDYTISVAKTYFILNLIHQWRIPPSSLPKITWNKPASLATRRTKTLSFYYCQLEWW